MPTPYIPPPIIYHNHIEESRPATIKPFFYECDGVIINLSAATKFYVEHLPFTSYYWPCVRIAGNNYTLSSSKKSYEEAMEFLKNLIEKIEKH